MSARRPATAPLQAYVLHHYDWSESSLILELFTRERGRIAAVAKGAKRPYSQLRVVLLPFQRLLVGLGRGADDPAVEVHTLRSAEWAGGAAMPGGAALFPGFHLNELLLRLLARHDPHAALFDAYAQTLPHLGDGDEARRQAALRGFELRLLREVGVLPELDRVTATQQPLREADRYLLRAETGVACAVEPGGGFAAVQLRALQAALDDGRSEDLIAACAAALPPLRVALHTLLHYHAGTPALRTRKVMADLRQLLEPRTPAP